MDLKIKGKTWVGSIYQKFESVCQEVDDIVSKEVKYVGNQVQTVGVGVKKFYSDVVQDLLPATDPAKCQLLTTKENNAIGTYISSIVGIKEKSLCVTGEETTREQNVVDLSEYHSSSMSCEADPERQFLCQLGANPCVEEETDIALEHDGGAAVNENSDISIDENVESEEQPVTENKSSFEDRNFSEPSLNSTDHYHIDTTLPEVSSPTSLHDSGFKSPDRIICENSSDEVECVQSSGLQIINISCDHKVSRAEVTSSSAPPSTEPVNMSRSFHANSTHNTQNSYWNYTDTVRHASHISTFSDSASVPISASDSEDVGMFYNSSNSLFSSISNDLDVYRNHGSLFVIGSSESRNGECSDSTQSKALMSSSLIGRMDNSNEDIADPSMETIDLSDKTTVNESCTATDNCLVFPASSRVRRFRSYKKLLKDAFTLRKRLSKEYEQLAIWYGDIDAEASQHFEFPSSPPTTFTHLSKSPTHDMWESDWELL